MTPLSHLITKLLLISSLGFSFNTAYCLGNKDLRTKTDTSSEVHIQGRIIIKNKAIKGNYKVEVMYFDAVMHSFHVKHNSSLKIKLKRNSPYVLRVSKKGFIPRLICINTHMESKVNNDTYSFYFETDFIKTAEAMRLDNEALELPVALISYDRKTNNFNSNQDYSNFVNQRIYGGVNELSPLNVKNN